MEKKEFLTVKEVATRFGFSDRTITRHIKRKLLPAIRLSSKHWLIKESDIEIYIENVKNQGGKVAMLFSEHLKKLEET